MGAQTKAGFSLVEVLVSLLILSMGIIGAASMQLTALRNIQQTGFHAVALQLANDIADQIRGLDASNINDASNPFLVLDFKNNDSIDMPAELCFGGTSACDGIVLAKAGIYEIESRLKLMLPQGRVKVCRDAMPWDDSNRSYTWDCHSGSGIAPIVVKLGWREASDGMPSSGKPAVSPQLVMLVQA